METAVWTDGLGFAPGLAMSPVDGGRIDLGGSEAVAAGTVAVGTAPYAISSRTNSMKL